LLLNATDSVLYFKIHYLFPFLREVHFPQTADATSFHLYRVIHQHLWQAKQWAKYKYKVCSTGVSTLCAV